MKWAEKIGGRTRDTADNVWMCLGKLRRYHFIRINLLPSSDCETIAGRQRIAKTAYVLVKNSGLMPHVTLRTHCIVFGYVLFGIDFLFWIQGIKLPGKERE